MKLPDDVIKSLVQQWTAKAGIDLCVADSLLRDSDPVREAIAFHCQQATEKYLKALLVSRQIEFPKTHDLEQLLDLLAPVSPELVSELDGIGFLNPFGVIIRYPGDFPELLRGQERLVIELARRTRDAVVIRLSANP